jgi:hypothetical protein
MGDLPNLLVTTIKIAGQILKRFSLLFLMLLSNISSNRNAPTCGTSNLSPCPILRRNKRRDDRHGCSFAVYQPFFDFSLKKLIF